VRNGEGEALTLQLGTRQVDGGRVGGWPGADDDDLGVHSLFRDGGDLVFVGCLVVDGSSSYRETTGAGAEGTSKGGKQVGGFGGGGFGGTERASLEARRQAQCFLYRIKDSKRPLGRARWRIRERRCVYEGWMIAKHDETS